MPLPTTISAGDSAASHRTHHQTLHAQHNTFEGTSPASFASALHNQTAATITDFATAVRSTVGAMFVDSASIDFTYNSGAGTVTAINTSGGSLGAAGEIILDTFAPATAAGLDADTKLTNAIAYGAAQTYKPVFKLQNALYSFATKGRTAYPGFALFGPTAGWNRPDSFAGTHEVRLTFNSADNVGWFHNNAEANFVAYQFGDLCVRSTSGTKAGAAAFLSCSADSEAWQLLSIQRLQTNGLLGTLGTRGRRMQLNAATIGGTGCMIANSWDTAIHIGGADSEIFTEGCLIDSPTSRHPGGEAYHLLISVLTKSNIGPCYITAEGNWGAIDHFGNTDYNVVAGGGNIGGPVDYWGLIIEGRNATAASNGDIIHVRGGIARFHGCSINYAMKNAAASGHSPTPAGVVHAVSGMVSLDACTYDRALTVAESVPFLYCTGSGTRGRARDISIGTNGGAWSDVRPLVTHATTPANLLVDASVRTS